MTYARSALSFILLVLPALLMGQTPTPPRAAFAAVPAADRPERPAKDLLQGAGYDYRLEDDHPFTEAVPSFKAQGRASFEARCRFTLPADVSVEAATLQLVIPDLGIAAATLNGQPVDLSVEGMIHHTLVIPGALFKPGQNELQARFLAESVSTLQPALFGCLFLTPLGLQELAFVAGPTCTTRYGTRRTPRSWQPSATTASSRSTA